MPQTPIVHLPMIEDFLLRNGTRIVWGHIEAGRSLQMNQVLEPQPVMHFTITGSVSVVAEKLGIPIDIRAGQHNLLYPGKGNLQISAGMDHSCQFLQVYLAPHFFGYPSVQDAYVVQLIVKLIQMSQPLYLTAENLPVTAAMHAILQQISTCSLSFSLKKIFIEAKVMELLVLQLLQYEQPRDKSHIHMTDYDYPLLMEARQILQNMYVNPPTLSALSRIVGMNESKLKKGFKALFGKPVYDWVLSYRLEQAYLLLQKRQLTISEVAYQVGYQHPAHFTLAFKKKYGIPPSHIAYKTAKPT